jgi:nitrogen-specific signal transduction histidine kinase
MSLVLSLATLAVLFAFWVRHERERRELAAVVAELTERLRELALRLDATEHETVAVGAHAEIAERVLLEKGYADADDLEAARRRLEGETAGARARGGELN